MSDTTVSSPIPGATIITNDGTVTQVPDNTTDEKLGQETTVELVSPVDDDTETDFDQQQYDSVKNLVMRKTVQADELSSAITELNESLKNIIINDQELDKS
jgi:hypothetical protein